MECGELSDEKQQGRPRHIIGAQTVEISPCNPVNRNAHSMSISMTTI